LSGSLAVIAPHVGAPSETFIRRHMTDLLPGRTVVVAETARPPIAGHWSVNSPTLILDEAIRSGAWSNKVGRAVIRLVGGRRVQTRAAERFLRQHRVEVILGEYLDLSLPWLDVAQSLGARFFGHAHGYDVSRSLRDPAWRSAYLRYNDADGVITVSRTSRQRLVELGLDAAKVHSVPCGVDVPAEPPARRRLGHESIRCVAVGRFVAKKAPILALDAFRRAAEALPTLRLDYVGGGELFAAARQFVHAFSLESRVTLHGVQPSETVARLLADADVFLQHSMTDPETGDEEGLPVAILEAMAQAVPVVSTRHAAIPEAVVDSVTGYLVDEGDSGAMSERLVALGRDPTLRLSLGQAGWLRAKRSFSWEVERARLLEILGFSSFAAGAAPS
jgi:glycosyltransferase involved in cell wall biosynthesis